MEKKIWAKTVVLFQSMPKQAEFVLNRSTEVAEVPAQAGKPPVWLSLSDVTRKTLEKKELMVKFNHEFMDDDFIWNKWEKIGTRTKS